jgi:hypothetical protein
MSGGQREAAGTVEGSTISTAIAGGVRSQAVNLGNLDRINPNMNLFQIINHF